MVKSTTCTRNNTKGELVVRFIAVLVLSIVAFSTTAAIVARFLDITSTQEKSFTEFVILIEEVAAGPRNAPRAHRLLLQEGASVVYFESTEPVQMDLFASGTSSQLYTLQVEIPQVSSCEQGSCICLLPVLEKDDEVKSVLGREFVTTRAEDFVMCHHIDEPLTLETCSLGTADPDSSSVVEYTCHNGFIFSRNLISTLDFGASYNLRIDEGGQFIEIVHSREGVSLRGLAIPEFRE